MTSTTVPPAVDAAPFPGPRIFGASPFHTDGELLALAFAPDGTLWSVEEPGVLRHWDLAARQQTAWHGLDELATLWCFSAGARHVAAGSDELSIWEVDSGRLEASWPVPSWVTALAFQTGTGLLASGHDDCLVRLWDRSGGQPLRELRGHNQAVSALAFSPDGSKLASAGEDRVISIWDVASGALCGILAGHTDRIPSLTWLPDGRLVSAGWDTTARVWDVAACAPLILLNSHATQVLALAPSPDGRLLACADSAHAVHLWDMTTLRTQRIFRGPASEVRCLAFAPDGDRIAVGRSDRVLRVWDVRQGPDQEETADPQLSRTCLALTPDAGRLLSLGAGTTLRVWDTATGQPAWEPPSPLCGGPSPVLRAFTASPDGRWVVVSRATDEPETSKYPPRNTLELWEAATGGRQALLEGQAAPLTALAFSPDSATVASGGIQSSDVWLWRIPSGQPALILTGAVEGCSVEALAFQPRGRLLAVGGIDWLATSGADGLTALWDLDEHRQVATLPGGTMALAFHPQGGQLAVATLKQTVRIWEVPGGRLVTELIGHLDAVTCLAYSPDGRWLASGGDDRTVRLWDPGTGVQQGLVELDTQVKAVCFASDGRTLCTGNGNTSCYRLDVEQLLARRGGRASIS